LSIGADGLRHDVRAAWAGPGRWAGTIDGRPFDAGVEDGDDGLVVRWRCLRFVFREDTGARHHASAEHEGHLRAPMPGHVLDVRVATGDRVEAGAVLVVLEAMKMEHSMVAPWAGTVIELPVKPGDRVEEGAELARLAPLAG
jgi:acetyl/propionyl-CoA carboxylase alpha subunit